MAPLPKYVIFDCLERGTGKGLSKEKISEIQSQIEADRKRLESQKDMAEEEKRKVEDDLAQKEAELQEAQYVLNDNNNNGSSNYINIIN